IGGLGVRETVAPALFAGAAKPLKLRIQSDIQQRAPGVFTRQSLSAFFRRYTGSNAYLTALSRSTERFDLDGVASGELAEEHRAAATTELARRRASQQARRLEEQAQRRGQTATGTGDHPPRPDARTPGAGNPGQQAG
ncbi:MAG TPA: ProQ/FINO family protein, partial [Burkholderiaceae bacterium]|nr:ProQ/FINO family protein [Burkholderiaceae bacterium]